MIANLLSPSTYLFWATIGTPLIYDAFKINLLTALLFVILFYFFMVGSKVMIAVIVARTKVFINQKMYVIIMRTLGVALLSFSLIFFYDGIIYLQ